MFTSRADSPTAYRGLWGESCVWSLAISVLISIVDGLSKIVRQEGPLGLFRGTSLALVGVSSGAIQFMVYEKMKTWGFERKRKQYAGAGMVFGAEADKLVCCPFKNKFRSTEKPDPVKFFLYRHVSLQQNYFPIGNLSLPSGSVPYTSELFWIVKLN